ncbi:MAG: alpha-galactosidase [Clostridiales bacterium]|nr:alpha-galactosidase [Clostridiales bacterium]
MEKRSFKVRTERTTDKITIESKLISDGIELCGVTVKFAEKCKPTKIRIEWEEDMTDCLNVFSPGCGTKHNMCQAWNPTINHSSFSGGVPLLYTTTENDLNRCAVALSDPVTPSEIGFYVDDFYQNFKVIYFVNLFAGNCDPITEYHVDIRIDSRRLPYYEVLRDVYPFFSSYGFKIPEPPEAAELPLYSSWYNFHQTPDQKMLLDDLSIAAELGFKTVILDDGWQFVGPPKGPTYVNCGDWVVAEDKFPDFKAFTDGIHKLGMKLVVWFALPFVGKNAAHYEYFKDMYLCDEDYQSVLDPRFKETRDYMIGTCRRFLEKYDIDGFKLDFIDKLNAKSDKKYDPERMDCETADEAIERLLSELVFELGKIKPDLMYEYRQGYIGPAINKFGNMLRVGDCAFDADNNRVNLTQLRLLGYPAAIHSDMLYWSKDEDVRLCARQLLKIMFSVPQISVILSDIPDDQLRLLRRFISYWSENRHILLHGEFVPKNPGMDFPEITARGKEKSITVLYSDGVYSYKGGNSDVFHCGNDDGIVVENLSEDSIDVKIYDCFGDFVKEESIGAGGIKRVGVLPTGMIRI